MRDPRERVSLERQEYVDDDDDDAEDSSCSDDLENLDFDEEDEIMQVVLDEEGVGNVIDHYNNSPINSDNDFFDGSDLLEDEDVVPLENQSMKTDAGVGSEIFEASPGEEREEGEEEGEVERDLGNSLRFLTDQLLSVSNSNYLLPICFPLFFIILSHLLFSHLLSLINLLPLHLLP